MASLLIGRRKPREEPLSSKKASKPSSSDGRSKCPVFTVQYLGKLPARGEYGREYISEPVECLLKLKEKQSVPKTTLTVSDEGFHFLDQNGPFGKEKHVLIPLHNICYGVADEKSPRVFAIITRTESNSESSLFECHAFLCDKRKTSGEITYWLLRTFLQVFEELQKKRKLRQERKLLRMQSGGREESGTVAASRNGKSSKVRSSYASERPFESGHYSVILEGGKGHGAAVGLALDRSRSRQSHNETSKRNPRGNENHRRGIGRDHNANVTRSPVGPTANARADVRPHAYPTRYYIPPSHHHHHQQQRPFVRDSRSTYVHSGGVQPQAGVSWPRQRHPYAAGRLHEVPPPRAQRPSSSSNGRYTKDIIPHLQEPSTHSRSRDDGAQSSVHDDSDFLFIDLLQEEFADGQQEEGFSVRSGRRGELIGPPNQKLRSEDIERRIREWLSAKEEANDERFVHGEGGNSSGPRFLRQYSSGDTVSLTSGDSYF